MTRRLLLIYLILSGPLAAQAPTDDDAARTQASPQPAAAGQRATEAEPDTESDAPEPAAEAPPSPDGGSDAGQADGVKTLSGMSILGNEEAPKSLVIVPWKSSRIGDGLGVTDSMDDRARPVDREVFMREVHYYELRAGAEQ